MRRVPARPRPRPKIRRSKPACIEVTAELRCLVCQNQTIADSHADLAVDLRNQVREMLRRGDSREQIIAYMTARYGDFVLYRPPLKESTALLWFGPALLMVGGARRAGRRAAPPRAKLPDESFEADDDAPGRVPLRRPHCLNAMTDSPQVLRQQLKQLRALHASGALGDAQYAESRAPLERKLVAGGAPAAAAGGRHPPSRPRGRAARRAPVGGARRRCRPDGCRRLLLDRLARPLGQTPAGVGDQAAAGADADGQRAARARQRGVRRC